MGCVVTKTAQTAPNGQKSNSAPMPTPSTTVASVEPGLDIILAVNGVVFEEKPQSGAAVKKVEVQRLTYMSLEKGVLSPEDIARIGRGAQRFNQTVGVTGFLIHASPCFFQTLEGQPEDVQKVMDNVRVDRRHHHISILERIDAPQRFPDWSMEVIDVSNQVSPPSERVQRLLRLASRLLANTKMGPESLEPLETLDPRYSTRRRSTLKKTPQLVNGSEDEQEASMRESGSTMARRSEAQQLRESALAMFDDVHRNRGSVTNLDTETKIRRRKSRVGSNVLSGPDAALLATMATAAERAEEENEKAAMEKEKDAAPIVDDKVEGEEETKDN